MADIALLSSTAQTNPSGSSIVTLHVEESIEQFTAPANAALEAGTPVQLNSAGKWVNCDASSAGTAKPFGITVAKVAANEAVTAIKRGKLAGFDFSSQNIGTDIFLSDTDGGKLADAAGTTSVKVGVIVPHHSHKRGGSPKKLLYVSL